MRATLAPLLFAALAVANPAPVPQAVTAAIAPQGSPPPGCSENYQGSFLIGPVNVTKSKRDVEGPHLDERNTQLGITLVNGILTDPQGRTGYIAANQQFQFDGPPQEGAIYTAGFSVCPNGTLALGSDVTWWKCLSGSFYNLYYESIGGQCIESYLITRPQGGSGGPLPPSVSPSGTVTIQTTSINPNATSSSATASSSGLSSSGAANATASSSGAAGASGSTTVITESSTTITSVIGGGTVGGHHTTATGGGNTNTRGGQQTTATGGGGGTATGAQSAASSSSSPGAAPIATMRAEVFGLAAGMLALAVL